MRLREDNRSLVLYREGELVLLSNAGILVPLVVPLWEVLLPLVGSWGRLIPRLDPLGLLLWPGLKSMSFPCLFASLSFSVSYHSLWRRSKELSVLLRGVRLEEEWRLLHRDLRSGEVVERSHERLIKLGEPKNLFHYIVKPYLNLIRPKRWGLSSSQAGTGGGIGGSGGICLMLKIRQLTC